jgi:hypothetical protein
VAATNADVARDRTVSRYRALLSRPVGTEVRELHNGRLWKLLVVGRATHPNLTTFVKDVRGWICHMLPTSTARRAGYGVNASFGPECADSLPKTYSFVSPTDDTSDWFDCRQGGRWESPTFEVTGNEVMFKVEINHAPMCFSYFVAELYKWRMFTPNEKVPGPKIIDRDPRHEKAIFSVKETGSYVFVVRHCCRSTDTPQGELIGSICVSDPSRSPNPCA